MRAEVKTVMLDLKKELVSPCGKCGGLGWLESVELGVPNPCDCMVAFHYLNALIEARIPRDYWWLGFDELLDIDPEYLKFCRWFSKRIPKAVANALGILFLGPNGIGKTSMQCSIGKEAIVQGYTVRYFTAQQYIESRKSDDKTLADYLESADMILLDELDKVYMTRSTFVEKTLEDFLRRVTSNGSSLVICTNYSEDVLESTFGQSTMSMLRRHLKLVSVVGGDYSDTLQQRWDDTMDSERDYYAPTIMSMAKRLMDLEISEEILDWKKTNT